MHIPPINKLDPQQQAFLDKVSAFVDNSSSSFRNQWIQGFAQLVFLFFCAFLSHFRTPI